ACLVDRPPDRTPASAQRPTPPSLKLAGALWPVADEHRLAARRAVRRPEAPAGEGEAAGGDGPPPGQSQARVDGCRVVHVESCGRVAPQAGRDEQPVPPGDLLLQHEAEGGRDRAQPLLTDTERTPEHGRRAVEQIGAVLEVVHPYRGAH